MQVGRKRSWFEKLGYDEQLLVAFAGIGSVLALLANVIAYFFEEEVANSLWINYMFLVLLLAAIPLQLQFRRFGLSASYLLIIGFCWLTASLVDRPTIHSNYLYWFAILPIFGGLLFRYQGLALGWSLAFMGIAGFLINSFRVLAVDQLQSGDDFIVPLSNYIIFLLMVGSLTLVFIKFNDALIQNKTRKLDTLLKIVSHDIANPLTLIRGLSDLLTKNSSLDERGRQQVAKIFLASDTIYRILERVRHIQAIKAGILVQKRVPCSVKEAILTAIALNENRLLSKKIELITAQSGEDIQVLADPVTLTHEVINNLLTNAIKFSNSGQQILLKTWQNAGSGVIEISDYGVGIPEPLLRDLFDEFKITSRLGTDGERGTGFGLPLVKSLIEAYGGYLEIESKSIESHPNEHGTAIRVFLPLASSEHPH